jgi:hypothetical protein
MAQAFSRRPVAVEAQFRSQASPCEICDGPGGTGRHLFPSTSVLPCQYHSASAPYSSSYSSCPYQKDKSSKSGNFAKSIALSEIGEHWIESTFTCFIFRVNVTYLFHFLRNCLAVVAIPTAKYEENNRHVFLQLFFTNAAEMNPRNRKLHDLSIHVDSPGPENVLRTHSTFMHTYGRKRDATDDI